MTNEQCLKMHENRNMHHVWYDYLECAFHACDDDEWYDNIHTCLNAQNVDIVENDVVCVHAYTNNKIAKYATGVLLICHATTFTFETYQFENDAFASQDFGYALCKNFTHDIDMIYMRVV